MNQNHLITRLAPVFIKLSKKIGYAHAAMGETPARNSIAGKELAAGHKDALKDAYAVGSQLIALTLDHVAAFTRTLTQPVLFIAPWATARSVIEISAMSYWLLDTGLNANERTKRIYLYRYDSLNGRKTFAAARNEPREKAEAQKRLDTVVAQANALGIHFNTRTDKMPGATQLINNYLGEPGLYSLLSAVTHGEHWAYQVLGFNPSKMSQANALEPNMPAFAVHYLAKHVCDAVTRQTVTKFELFGWPTDELVGAISQAEADIQTVFEKLK